jgi:hypothetical protein
MKIENKSDTGGGFDGGRSYGGGDVVVEASCKWW